MKRAAAVGARVFVVPPRPSADTPSHGSLSPATTERVCCVSARKFVVVRIQNRFCRRRHRSYPKPPFLPPPLCIQTRFSHRWWPVEPTAAVADVHSHYTTAAAAAAPRQALGFCFTNIFWNPRFRHGQWTHHPNGRFITLHGQTYEMRLSVTTSTKPIRYQTSVDFGRDGVLARMEKTTLILTFERLNEDDTSIVRFQYHTAWLKNRQTEWF